MNPGPPPDPNALRRDRQQGLDKDGWTTLPAGGFDGPVPEWPLTQRPADSGSIWNEDDAALDTLAEREQIHWTRLWRTPQAAAWTQYGWLGDVALYARLLARAETGDLKAATETRQWSDRLGLNPAAMMRNRWRIAKDQLTEKRADKPTVAPVRTSSRDRLKAVGGDA